jgi:serine protease Do
MILHMNGESAARFDEAFSAVGEKLRRSTVQVFDGRRGAGSGVIWRADGWIVTNAHVVRGSTARIRLADGAAFDAEVIARASERDLAALYVAAASDLPAAEIGASTAVRVGEIVLAAGSPFGVRGAVSAGVLHAVGAVPRVGKQRWLQADLELAPGNSGGPLADASGRVIGINSMIAMGLGLAIPSHEVGQFLRRAMRRREAA